MTPTTTRFGVGDGVELAADVAGDPADPAVLLFHGGGQTRHSWSGALFDLAGRGFHVVTVDLRGHGDSDWSPDGDYGPDVFSSDIISVARRFDRPALVGASLGGLSSLRAIARTEDDPIASGLVLVDVAPNVEMAGVTRIREFMRRHIDDGFASLDDVADAVQAYNPHRPRPTNLDGLRKNVRQRDDGRWYWHWDPAFMSGPNTYSDETRALDEARRREDLVAAARALTVPTLLVRGRQSDLLSTEGARQFLEMAPHAEFADVAGAGHMVAGDRNDAFNEAVIGFLTRLR